MNKKEPLVSIAIPNYNYGRYLANCLDSILGQTYSNMEVLFRDNSSTDNSMDIVREYEPKFKERKIPFYPIENSRNVGSESNTNMLLKDVDGKYFYVLASDDAIEPTMIEECVEVFEKYPSVGMVMTGRVEVDDEGTETEVAPFYNCKCVIPGDKQAAVFMMSGIAIPGERMMRCCSNLPVKKYKHNYQVAGDWFNNYLSSCCNDIAYINKPLCRYRVHRGNETNVSEKELLGIFEHYKLINDFYELSLVFDQKEATLRYREAVEKLSSMSIRYATRCLKHGERTLAVKYLKLAPVFNTDIVNDENYILLEDLAKASDREISDYFENNVINTTRKVSYDPPEGSIIIGEK